jgi:glycerol-3-phosphate dehydrogenase
MFDVAIVGGGVQGMCLFDRLVSEGRRVLLCDQGDFGGGTTQASAMLLWGGLLYLKNGDLLEVARLSASRDSWLARFPELAEPHFLSYVYGPSPHRNPRLMAAILWLYWALSRGSRTRPRRDCSFAEQEFLSPGSAAGRLRFEEGRLRLSDTQLLMGWLASSETACALNYCACTGGGFDPQSRRWSLELHDQSTGRAIDVSARCVVNAAGVWADQLNGTFGIQTPWQHLLARGVSLCVPRPATHRDTIVFDDAYADEGFSLVPWGPVALWGSNEVLIESPENCHRADRADIVHLLARLNHHTRLEVSADDVVNLRVGVRGLIVPRGMAAADPTRLSRRWRVHPDPDRQWITLYGGKITSCFAIAARAATVVEQRLGRSDRRTRPDRACSQEQVRTFEFPGVPGPIPTAGWCREWQQCRTLEDYLRRRTNIAQWVPRGGLGRTGEHRDRLIKIAGELCDDPAAAADEVARYESNIERDHDGPLGITRERRIVHA